MKPKTKLQKKIVELSSKLPDLNKDQVAYLREKLFKHKATVLKSGKISCLDCGHQWQSRESNLSNVILGVTCPNCKRELQVEQTRKKVFSQCSYYQVIETFKGHQILRTYEAKKYFKAGKPMEFYHWKIYEHWITPKGKVEIVGKYMTSKWREQWGGGYELRSNKASTDYGVSLKDDYIYPKKRFIPELKKRGIKTSVHGVNPLILFIDLLTGKDPRIETLVKAKQFDLIVDKRVIENHWPSIKICLRNNYQIKDARMWNDYIDYLKYFGKDVRNPKYVCPEDLHKEHDRYMDKKNKAEADRKIEERLEQIQEEQAIYKKKKAKYMGLSFTDGDLEVSFMNSVEQLARESIALHHCAFSNDYHKKDHILMFSVRVKGRVKATGAVNIDRKNVAEVRGQNNWQSEHNTPENRLLGQRATVLLQNNMITILNGKRPERKKTNKSIQKQEIAIAS